MLRPDEDHSELLQTDEGHSDLLQPDEAPSHSDDDYTDKGGNNLECFDQMMTTQPTIQIQIMNAPTVTQVQITTIQIYMDQMIIT